MALSKSLQPVSELVRKPASHLDSLPNELLENIMKRLPSADIFSLFKAYPRAKEIAKNSGEILKTLKLHKAFFRRIKDAHYFYPNRRVDNFFVFKDDVDKLSYILDVAKTSPTGGNLEGLNTLIFVLASGMEEADALHRGLRAAGCDSYLSFGYIPRDIIFKCLREDEKVFVVAAEIDVNFCLTSMAVFVNCVEPESVQDFLEIQSLNPRRVHQMFEPNFLGFEMFEEIQELINVHSGRFPDRQRALQLSREVYRERCRDRRLLRLEQARERSYLEQLRLREKVFEPAETPENKKN